MVFFQILKVVRIGSNPNKQVGLELSSSNSRTLLSYPVLALRLTLSAPFDALASFKESKPFVSACRVDHHSSCVLRGKPLEVADTLALCIA